MAFIHIVCNKHTVSVGLQSGVTRRDLPLPPPAKEHKRFAILIPAYREDAVIHECVHSCLEQDYPAACFDTVVISDRMQPETNASLAVLPIRLVEVTF